MFFDDLCFFSLVRKIFVYGYEELLLCLTLKDFCLCLFPTNPSGIHYYYLKVKGDVGVRMNCFPYDFQLFQCYLLKDSHTKLH